MATTGILVNPQERKLSIVKVGAIQELIECKVFTIAYPGDQKIFQNDAVCVDDEGLFKPGLFSFHFANHTEPLFGKGLILGANSDGKSTTPHVSFKDYESLYIKWADYVTVR